MREDNMGYLKIPNLYKDSRIFDLNMSEVYALEKIHGTSAHIRYKKFGGESLNPIKNGTLSFFSGGEKYEEFVSLFDEKYLQERFDSFQQEEITVYGEAYGGKQQGMRGTYGDDLKFVVFDAKINGVWLSVVHAHILATYLKLEFVHYTRIPCTLEAINAERDADSVQALRNGMGAGKMREGVVLRPIEECVDDAGDRIITKHKRDEFRETFEKRSIRLEREMRDPERYKKLSAANAIAKEWVTPRRLHHVLDQAQAVLNNIKGLSDERNLDSGDIAGIIDLMIADIEAEGQEEIVESQEARKAIGRATALLFKKWLSSKLESKGV